MAGDFSYGQRFWRDEYRLNAKLFEFPKPVVSFLQGFTMGGGVGVGCHGSHRIVCDTSRIAMPECGIGLLPDIGGSLLLARAPGRLGEYLGVTGDRMDAGDAIHAGFADYYVPQGNWANLTETLCKTGDWTAVDRAAHAAPPSRLAAWQADIDAAFAGERLGDCIRSFDRHPSPAVDLAKKAIARNSPLAMTVAVEVIHRVRAVDQIRYALEMEYRFTHRALDRSDFLEGIRAAIIDKDKAPKWRHKSWEDVTGADILAMTMPLTDAKLTFERDTP
jgi:enoyl-CoA hydratase/carnithine racemase